MKKITLLILLLTASISSAQDTIQSNRKNAIGFSAGTGFGIDYSRVFTKNLYATLSYNALPFNINGIEKKVNGENLLIDTELDFKNIDIKLSYHPFSNAFNIIAGFGYFSSSQVTADIQFKDEINIGDIVFSTTDIGKLHINSTWSKATPYLGFGFGRAVPRKRLGFNIEFGSYFSSSPKITLDATGLIEQTKDQQVLLNQTFKSFKFIPYASFRLSYSI